jgi:hypothetical protein
VGGRATGADAPSGEMSILNKNNLIFSVNKFYIIEQNKNEFGK